MLEWIAWDSFEFEKASRVSRYSFLDPYAFYSRSYYAPFWYDLCNSSDYAINSCPYYACYAQPDFVSHKDNTDVVINLPDSSFPLAQCTWLEINKPFRVIARFNVVCACFKSKDTLDEVHDLVRTPLKGSRDMVTHKAIPSLDCTSVLSNPLDHSYVSLMCS